MLTNKVHRTKRLVAFTTLCFVAAPCFSGATPTTTGKSNLTPTPIRHSVECLSPHKDLCVIKKPVGTGYRILTPEIALEDAGEYWLADFIKSKLTTKKMTFRVMGKDNDVHEIEILFRNVKNVKNVKSTPATPTPNTSEKTTTE